MVKISDIVVTPSMDLAKAKKIFDDRKPQFCYPAAGISFCRVTKTGPVTIYVAQPCHGRLQGNPGASYVATRVSPRLEQMAFFKWWTTESYAAPFIMNADTALEDGYVIITGDIYFPFMNCLNITARSFYEKPYKAEYFGKLVSKGVPHPVAFAVVFGTNWSYFKDIARPTSKVGPESVHSPLSYLSVEGLTNFFKGIAPGYKTADNQKYSTVNGDFNGGVFVWEENGYQPRHAYVTSLYNTDPVFKGLVDKFRGVKTTKAAFDNPFKRVADGLSTLCYLNCKEFEDVLIPYVTQIYNEVTNATECN